jgi:nicotinamidase-related amidase
MIGQHVSRDFGPEPQVSDGFWPEPPKPAGASTSIGAMDPWFDKMEKLGARRVHLQPTPSPTMIGRARLTKELPQAPGGTALLIIDMINDMAFEEGDDLLAEVEAAVDVIARLGEDAEAANVPVIFINDNFGQWHFDRERILDYVAGTRGRDALERLRPRQDDYFVIKPQVSGFYATNLPVLLPRLGVNRLILVGVAADICVLFTAADAHMREYALWVPRNAAAGDQPEHRDWALGIMKKSMEAETRPTSELPFDDWLKTS